MNFRSFRDRIMTYRDDFIRANTVARVEKINAWLQPHLKSARDACDVYILRGIAHYKGQCSIRETLSLWVLEGAAAVFLCAAPLLLLWDLFKKPVPSDARAYFALLGPVDARVAALFKVPEDLANVPHDKTYAPRIWHLSRDDFAVLGRLFVLLLQTRCPFPLQYLWKAFKDMALIRTYLDTYPKAQHALIAAEYSCAVSLHGFQYHLAGVPLYNVMHGDNASTPMECFFKLDRFYAWDAHYIELFRDQQIEAEYRVSPNPDFMLRPGERLADRGVGVVIPMINFLPDAYTSLEALIEAFGRVLAATGTPMCLRPHPAYPQTFAALKSAMPQQTTLSDPRAQSPHDFILSHHVLIGFYSTVLVEAAHMGAKVIVIRSPGSEARADYHGIFKRPNVRHVALPGLPQALQDFISGGERISNVA